MDPETRLTNQLLFAMPSLRDPNFSRTVTLICEHNDDGALGLVINRPTDLSVGDIFAEMSLEAPGDEMAKQPVLQGGPVGQGRGFVLHGADRQWESTLKVSDDIQLTTSRDILVALAEGSGPNQYLFALGYAGWTSGQLEAELSSNSWLQVPCTSQILFDTPYASRWHQAASMLGISPDQLSGEAGHA